MIRQIACPCRAREQLETVAPHRVAERKRERERERERDPHRVALSPPIIRHRRLLLPRKQHSAPPILLRAPPPPPLPQCPTHELRDRGNTDTLGGITPSPLQALSPCRLPSISTSTPHRNAANPLQPPASFLHPFLFAYLNTRPREPDSVLCLLQGGVRTSQEVYPCRKKPSVPSSSQESLPFGFRDTLNPGSVGGST